MKLTADQYRTEGQKQTQELSNLISKAIEEHTKRTSQPMLNSLIGALASHMGRAISHLDACDRKKMRDAAVKTIKLSERVNNANGRTEMNTVQVLPTH